MQCYLQSHHAESLLVQNHTNLFLCSAHAPQNFTCTSSKGLFSLLVIVMLSLADAKCLSHADDPQECKWAIAMTNASGCEWADLQAKLES